ncbi:MAG: aminoacetone oxidase family FAD-binding enzyme [Lachnospiraceae bacterium]|nr:aminoacetone oxidase family FAD-binding enzyme [Lachnospiraceae bacterium]
MDKTDILIAGGGAAGIMAALVASGSGAGVTIIEKMPLLGKKILATGNGRCNYTNYYQAGECYRSSSGTGSLFAWDALKKFGCRETVELFRKYGIMPYEKDGYVYPLSGQASSVRDILERQLKNTDTVIHTDEKVFKAKTHINRKNMQQDGFIIETDKNQYFASKLVIATGGKAGYVHGADGSGYKIARCLGHSLVPPLPALTSCILDEKFLKDWAGVRTKGTVRAYSGTGQLLCEDSGELQFVAQGISGIPVFQVSRYISSGLYKKENPYLVIDIMPLYSIGEITSELKRRREDPANHSAGDMLEGILNSRLALALLKKCGISVKCKPSGITGKEISKIAKTMKEWRLNPQAPGGFDKAQVTCGGIPVPEIDGNTMESKICKGLYFAGEIADIDGICGGYNLQWAWTSGYIAGSSAVKTVIK